MLLREGIGLSVILEAKVWIYRYILILIFQGSIQEERARHLQEDLNASREKYEKSQEEVQFVRQAIFVFASLRSLFIDSDIIISTFIDCREGRENPKLAKRDSDRERTTRSTSTAGVIS